MHDLLRCSLLPKMRNFPLNEAPQVYQDARAQCVAQLPSFASVKSTLYRIKSSNFPPLPADSEELILNESCKQTTDGKRFLLFDMDDATDGRFLCWATDEQLIKLSQVTEIFIDGTFFKYPLIFNQLLSIGANISGVHVTLVYMLLLSKKKRVYLTALRKLISEISLRGYSTKVRLIR